MVRRVTFIRFWNFNGHGYGLNVSRSDWSTAQSYALEQGGYLVEIDSAAENSFLESITLDGLTGLADDVGEGFVYADTSLEYTPSKSISFDGGGAAYLWTGGTDAANEGQWIWSNSKKSISLTNPLWGSGAGITEPDNFGGGQNYLGFAHEAWPIDANPDDEIGQSGQWNDIKGNSLLYSIVEFDFPVDETFGPDMSGMEDQDTSQPGELTNQYALDKIQNTYSAPLAKNGSYYDYKFFNLGNGRFGIQSKSGGGIDEITDAGQITFSDGVKAIDADIAASFNLISGKDDITGQTFRLYSAAFTRHPDSSGLKYWIDVNAGGLMSLAQTAAEFASSVEFADRYGDSLSDKQYVETLYSNVLGRLPDEAGSGFWLDVIQAGSSRGYVLFEFSESVENKLLFTQLTGIG